MCNFFWFSFKKKISVFSRIGDPEISLRHANKLGSFFENRSHFNHKIVLNLSKEKRKKILLKIGKKIINDRFNGLLTPDEEIDNEKLKLINKKFSRNKKIIRKYDKKIFCKKFNWQASKPIAVILANDLTDGLFTSKKRVFYDNYTWLRETIIQANKNKNLNWLVKPHPKEIKNKVTLTTKNLFEKLNLGDHVQLMPENYSTASIRSIVNIVFANHGSAGYEYPASGIPAVTASEAIYSYLNISIEAKNKQEYFKIIRNCQNIKSVKRQTRENALLFTYLYSVLSRAKLPVPSSIENFQDFGNNKFWRVFKKNFKDFSFNNNLNLKKDIFYKSLYNQIKNKHKHTLNIKELNKLNYKYLGL